jgi:uncharacterized protein (DUF1330 family)
MIPFVKAVFAILVGTGIGVVSMHTLRAQTKPPAFVIAEVDVTDQDAYMKEFLPARAKAIADAGGRYIVRGGQPRAVTGSPPAGRVIVVQFDSIDKLVAFTESPGFKDSQAIGEKYANIRIYGVEGVLK